jgi:hypothetical protein
VKRVAKTVLLVFAIITLVVGAVFMTIWTIIFLMNIAIEAQFPGSTWTPAGLFIYYFTLIMGIVLIAVAILLFILRARKKD